MVKAFMCVFLLTSSCQWFNSHPELEKDLENLGQDVVKDTLTPPNPPAKPAPAQSTTK